MGLPATSHDHYWSSIHPDRSEWWSRSVRTIADRHSLALATPARAPSGRNIVVLADDCVVKLVPPFWAQMGERERVALARLGPLLSIRTPQLIASGSIDSWTYLVMERLTGESLGWRAERGSPDERAELAHLQGRLAREISLLPPIEELRWDWAEVLREDGEAMPERLQGLPPALAEAAGDFIGAAGDLAAGDVTLHGDLASINLLRTADASWALIDWSDAGTGPADHEFISPFMHQFRGRADDLDVFWAGYGEVTDREAVQRRIAARSILKYTGLLPGLLADLPGPAVANWDEFAERFSRIP